MAYIHNIFIRFLENSCTAEELSILLRYFELDEYSMELKQLVEEEIEKMEVYETLSNPLRSMVERNRLSIMEIVIQTEKKKKVRYLWRNISIAASILLLSFFTFTYFIHTSNDNLSIVQNDDVEPGTNRAILKLEGKTGINLSEDKNGIVMKNGKIVYSDGTFISDNTNLKFATLTIPRKGQYQLTLPDGTKVWLNAETSLRYPIVFNGAERLVELEGEAYFEVVNNVKQPFVVKSGDQRLQVLGTKFNVHAYPDEKDITTTLVSGKVELSSSLTLKSQMLEPNQQSILQNRVFEVDNVDATIYTAWKDGSFRFKGTPLSEVLNQLERWYDLEIDYNSIPPNIKIHALLAKDKKLSSLLYALEKSANIKFKLEGRRLMLME